MTPGRATSRAGRTCHRSGRVRPENPQALLGFHSESRWLCYASKHLSGMFPYLPQRAGRNKRLRSAFGPVKRMIRELATDSDFWFDNHWIADSTPLSCGMSRPTVQRPDPAG